ncbi:hypothetical protein GCM10009546_01360 [Actinomadura livida]|uniref:Uncharacterized protein n=1 Tax=Actinomadura livida TaxID=79909 RepID=A0A7W7I7R8_9ACTN|nr:hypothetical protein [Actinomadura catellatispora]GGU02213.1 hypothetical protein GCM10010208_27600 [Actinomadura livida]
MPRDRAPGPAAGLLGDFVSIRFVVGFNQGRLDAEMYTEAFTALRTVVDNGR